MMRWLAFHAWDFGWRFAITAGALYTIYRLGGYFVNPGPLIIIAVLTILVTRFWARYP